MRKKKAAVRTKQKTRSGKPLIARQLAALIANVQELQGDVNLLRLRVNLIERAFPAPPDADDIDPPAAPVAESDTPQ